MEFVSGIFVGIIIESIVILTIALCKASGTRGE